MRKKAAPSTPVHVGAVAALALALLLSACGSNRPGTTGSTGSGPSGQPTASSPARPPTSGPTGSPSPTASSPPAPGKPLPVPPTGGLSTQSRVSGTIIEGVQPTCRILQTTNRRYALTGPAVQGLRVGDRVSVSGVERTDLISPCGVTFVVHDLTRS